MDHQRVGIDFLTRSRHGLLAFEQGLGKTLVALEAFRREFDKGCVKRLLVICPNSLKRNWQSEIEKYAPGFVADIVEGPPKLRRAGFAESHADIVITSYETARSEVTSLLALLQRSTTALVLDESHAAKNWRSLTSTAIRHLAPYAEYRWLLSGTPVTNSPEDLFTQIEILSPEKRLLGSLERFKVEAENDPTLRFARDRIDELVLRKTKEECLDLPDKTFADVRIELPDWQRSIYDDMRTDMVCAIRAMSGNEYRAFASTALTQLTRLMQIASNPGLLFPEEKRTPGKFEAIDGAVGDILSLRNRKVIIWSNYVSTIESLMERYKDQGVVALYGGVPAAERQSIASQFQTDEETRILIGNPAAAGTGFTFTAASFSIYESLSWRYDYYAQSQDRNHRIGQNLPVTYLRMIANDTIEEAVIAALDRKAEMAAGILGDPSNQNSISNFSREQMCHMLLHNELPHG